MTVGTFSSTASVYPTEWYALPEPELQYIFPVLNFEAASIVLINAYSKNGLSTPTGTVALLDADDVVLKSETLKDYDTGSSRNFSELITEVPAGSAKIRFQCNVDSFVSMQVLKLK